MSSTEIKPVFYDPSRARWQKIRAGGVVVGGFSLALVIALIVIIVIDPLLPSFRLSNALANRLRFLGTAHASSRLAANGTYQHARRLLMREHARHAPVAATSSKSGLGYESIGFFVNWDDTSFTSLKTNLPRLDVVIGEWLHLGSASGTLTIDNVDRERAAVAYIRSHKPDTKIYELVNNYTGQTWLGDAVASVLVSTEKRARVIDAAVSHATENGYNGISVDFENLPDQAKPLLTVFMRELSARAHAVKLAVTVNVPADDDSFEYAKLAAASDGVIVMAYDEHWAAGSPGPIASQSWFDDVVAKREREIPASKLIVAIGNYGYDWTDGQSGTELTFQDAVLTASESEGDVNMEDVSMNPMYEYADDANRKHEVWMLDAVTAFNELESLTDTRPLGVALWRLGSEDPSIWNVFGKPVSFTAETAATLRSIAYGYDIEYDGRGEILQLAAVPKTGLRDVVFDSDQGFVTTEAYASFPSSYVIRRSGAKDKEIALTFDDGPDPAYTPKILDILKKEGVRATFFDVGMSVEQNPDLFVRTYDEGHEIGNHTFTHPNIAELRPRTVRLELSATERLFGSLIGRETSLFRPPYAEDVEPETPDQVLLLETTSNLGYVDVGMGIDPGDWQTPGADVIVNRVIRMADAGSGNIVLLHDGGGDRMQTVEALPKIIEGLKARGYRLVLVSDLIGKTRNDVMPAVPAADRIPDAIGGVSFRLIADVIAALMVLGYVGIGIGVFRSLFVGMLAVVQARRDNAFHSDPSFNPSVAVVIPAFNEERVITRTIASLLASDHPDRFEIIVIDDGSTDGTSACVRETFGGDPRVRLFTKPNGGKAAALNHGIAQTDAEIIICLDADTIFPRDCIVRLVERFTDPRVGAVAGNAKVGNRINIVTRLQAIEYVTSQNLDRRAFSLLNCVTVVPGAVGAWRRELVVQAGMFSSRTLAEDADLTLTIRELGYRIAYADAAIALTEAPDTLRGFLKQRFRWMFGTLQVAWAHRGSFFRPSQGALGFIALPSIVAFQIVFPFISPIMDLMLAASVVWTGVEWYMHPLSVSFLGLRVTLGAFLLFTIVDVASAVLAFSLERREDWKLLLWLAWQRFVYRQLIYYVAVRSVIAGLRGSAVGWNKVERKGTVQEETTGGSA